MTKMAKSVNNAKTNAKKRAKTTQNGLTPHLWPIFLADLGTPLSNDHPCSWSETNIGCFSDQPPDGRRRTIVCCRCHEGGGVRKKSVSPPHRSTPQRPEGRQWPALPSCRHPSERGRPTSPPCPSSPATPPPTPWVCPNCCWAAGARAVGSGLAQCAGLHT